VSIQTATTTADETYTLAEVGGAAFLPATSATPVDNTLSKWDGTAGKIKNSSITDNGTSISTSEPLSSGGITTTGKLIVSTESDDLATSTTVALSGSKTFYEVTDASTASTANVTATVTSPTAGQVIYIINNTTHTFDVVLNSQNVHPGRTGTFIYYGGAWVEMLP
jgi:hypothetical protein